MPSKAKYFQWEQGFDSNRLLTHLAKIRKIDSGTCSFSAGEYHYWLPVLNSAVRANGPVGRLKDHCIRKAVSDPTVKLNNPDEFLIRCDEIFATLAARPKSKFILYTTVTYSGPRLIEWIADRDTRIYWQPHSQSKLLRKIRKAQESYQQHLDLLEGVTEGDGLTPLLVHVSAYDARDAFEIANDSVDRFRGLLNLLINSSNSINPFSELEPPHAVNKIRRGPFHSIHKPDGSTATGTFWYEDRWKHKRPTVKFADPPKYRQSIRNWWHKLQENPLHDMLALALLRYCRALDLHENDAAFLGVWQVLEQLMGTHRYELLIDRIVRLVREPDDVRQIANHVRIRRNQTVHSPHDMDRGESNTLLLHIEFLASRAIFFGLTNGAKFANARELHHFLDLSMNQKELLRNQELTRFFIQYQNR